MKLRNCSLQLVKDLYMIKIKAMARNDKCAIDHLKSNYPELFDATFLLDTLRNVFENGGDRQNNNLPFKHYLTNMH